MGSVQLSCSLYSNPEMRISGLKFFPRTSFAENLSNPARITALARSNTGHSHRKTPKNLRYPRRKKLPADPRVNTFLRKKDDFTDPSQRDLNNSERPELSDYSSDLDDGDVKEEDLVWSPDEIEAISSLFQGRIPQKPGNLYRKRPLPLPLPYKIRPLGLPTSKEHVRRASPVVASSRSSLSTRVYKNPDFLIDLAREIKSLPLEKDVSAILNRWARFLRKGSLSLTIRELGHMGLPDRALQTFCWAQKQPQLYPDDRILASTVEILARTRGLKMPFDFEKLTSSANRSVIEATVRGFIRGGSLNLARKLLLVAKDKKRTLDPSLHAKLILELGKNPDKYELVLALLGELGEREDLKLNQQDCTSVMKVCIRLGKFDIVESLFNWFKESGHDPGVVMYTTMIHSRYCEKKYREALALLWEMEGANSLLDLPAYGVVIKLCVALNDLSRAVRYFSRLNEAGFTPTYDIYRDLIKIYAGSGRLAKCKDVCKEVEMAGFKLDKQTSSLLLQMEEKKNRVS
ncbi:hypothetical protein HHK36_030827 [Tetracentron sinense]|uniref:Pentatricopeptide repeat-containing protein n=1 Tax=Tetracentron sinense TaxID=13715 RepID=A0A834YBS3_TETSI|nr:hypothetical protein HHK36_030827 [Tetracentron sinense]